MEKTIQVKDGPRFVSIEVTGSPTETSIFKDGLLVTSSLIDEPHTFTLYLEAGEYQVSTDGQLKHIGLSDVDHSLLKKSPSMEDLRQAFMEKVTTISFETRRALIPDYRLQNAALGIYDGKELANIKATVEAFREEYYRIKTLAAKAKTQKGLDNIKIDFPKEIIVK